MNCGWCNKETPTIYKLKDGKYLCLECATKHYEYVNEKMERYIETIRSGLNKKKNKLNDFKQAMCQHENIINTNYCVGTGKNIKTIWQCPDCGKRLYKDFEILTYN